MKNLGIKYQLRMTTLIPVFLVAILFAFFYNGQYSKDLNYHTFRLGEAYIRQLLPVAQYAIMYHDVKTLHGLINASTINAEIKALAFYDAQGKLLAYRGGKHSMHKLFKYPAFSGDYIESRETKPYTLNFLGAITIQKFNIYSSEAASGAATVPVEADDILGWISLDIDTQSTLIKKYQMYIVTIFITLFGILMSLTIHHLLARQIYLPISRLRRSMHRILSDVFDTPITVSSGGELGIIEQGAVHLQTQYTETIRDLNAQIETATADLHRHLELLEEKNIQQTLERKKYEEKWRSKSELIAHLSHEIRNPMNGVVGFTQVLLESKLDSLQRDYVKTIKTSAQDLLMVINDVLDYSKMEAGKLHLDCRPLDIRACMDEVLALAAPSAYKKGLELMVVTELVVPRTVLGDPLRIKQITTNLVNNAIKFTDQGHILIRVNIEQETATDLQLCFSITDTGVGIPEEAQPKLFQAFNQVDPSVARRFGGSGLGLVICKKLAEQMQGYINLKSAVNGGSTFSVVIRVEKFLMGIQESEQYRMPTLLANALCFDESSLGVEALCKGLEYLGVNCRGVTEWSELKQAYKEANADTWVFIHVPLGWEEQVAQIIEKQNDKKVICMLSAQGALQDANVFGSYACLMKPVSVQKLHEIVASLQYGTPLTRDHELEDLRRQWTSLRPSILIAEDNAFNSRLLVTLLGKQANIETVQDGIEAVNVCQLHPFDVILLDINMPNLNGIEAAKRIRESTTYNQQTPILVISADSYLSENRLQQVGVNFYLQKPIDEKQLLHYLLRVVKFDKPSAIDWNLCVQKASGNPVRAKTFLSHFIEELRNSREELNRAETAQNLNALGEAAHKLYGACCFCGVPDLQREMRALENQAKMVHRFEEIQTSLKTVHAAIDAVLKEFHVMNIRLVEKDHG
ncbi:MAG: response regulator [Legionella sp.]|nr:response regulator [Legionella sp.]